MSDLALLIDRDGASLDASDADVLTLKHHDGAGNNSSASRVGLHAIDSVIVDAQATLSSRALRRLAKCGIGLTIVGQGRQPDVFWAQPAGAAARLRHAQHLAVAAPAQRLALARYLLHAKLQAQEALLADVPAPAAADRLAAAMVRLQQVDELAGLRGVEGAAARAYWASWARQWPAAWGFKSRERRPPGDPVNALLSLGYTLATGEATRQVALAGLDPWLGVVHETRPPAVALAFDVVEGARPAVDEWVGQLVRREHLTPEHFEPYKGGGVRLLREQRRIVYLDWFAHGLPQVRQRVRHVLRGFTALLAASPGDNSVWKRASFDDDDDDDAAF